MVADYDSADFAGALNIVAIFTMQCCIAFAGVSDFFCYELRVCVHRKYTVGLYGEPLGSLWSCETRPPPQSCPKNSSDQRWKWVSGSWVTVSDPLTHDEITAQ